MLVKLFTIRFVVNVWSKKQVYHIYFPLAKFGYVAYDLILIAYNQYF